MPHMWKRAALAARVEAAPGTPEALSWSTDAIRVLGAMIPQRDWLAPNRRDDAITGSLDTPPSAEPAGEYYRIPLRFPLIGAGSAYAYTNETTKNVPECHALLRAAGMSLAVTGGGGSEAATYSQNDDPVTTITIWLEVGGKKYVFTACQAESFKQVWAAGSFPVVEATFIGVANALTEQALEAATYDSFTAAPWTNMKGTQALVVGSFEPEFQGVDIEHGLSTGPLLNGNAADAHGGYKITSRRLVLTVRARTPALASWDPMLDEKNKTPRAITMRAGLAAAGGQYKRVKFSAASGVAENVQMAQDGDFINWTVPYNLGTASPTANLIFD